MALEETESEIQLLEPVSQKAPRVIGRQAGEIVVPDDFCDEDPEILALFGIE